MKARLLKHTLAALAIVLAAVAWHVVWRVMGG
jgi:hypothetical protein